MSKTFNIINYIAILLSSAAGFAKKIWPLSVVKWKKVYRKCFCFCTSTFFCCFAQQNIMHHIKLFIYSLSDKALYSINYDL